MSVAGSGGGASYPLAVSQTLCLSGSDMLILPEKLLAPGDHQLKQVLGSDQECWQEGDRKC